MSHNELFLQWQHNINNLIDKHPLQIVSWEATRRCNLNCQHCGSPRENSIENNELSTEEIINVFQQIRNDFDMNQFRHINITGGEPFERKDLLEILQFLHQYPYFRNIDIQTNGIYIAENLEILDELKRYGVTGLGISIDGFEDSHDALRRFNGGFEKAVTAVKEAVKHDFVTTVSFVVHSNNYMEIPSFFTFVKNEIKPRVFRVMTVDPIGRVDLESDLLLAHNQLKEVISFLKSEYAESCHTYGNPKSTMVELGCGGWFGKELEGTFRPFIFHCIAGINNLGILYDGKMASCSNISRDFIEGDVRKDRIKDIWESKYKRYRNFEWRKIGGCQTCVEWDFCHGGPMHKCATSGEKANCLYLDYVK